MGTVLDKFFMVPLAALAMGFGLTWAAAVPKKKAATKAPATKAAVTKGSATKGSTGKSAAKAPARGRTTTYARGRTRGRSPQPVVVRRYRGQQAPTQERYMEIQQALVTRGYLQTPPSGTWDTATVEALKKFQEEQNLPPTGKITSLSLIALGLGPKRNPLTASAQPPAGQAPAQSAPPVVPEAPVAVP